MSLDVAVVIVTYNSQRHVLDLLASLPPALGDLTSSVVVVDNGSTDATLTLLEGRADCVVVRSTNDGFAAGVNRGVAASPEARAILVLNPDTTMEPGSVPTMMGVLRKPGVGIVSPRLRDSNGELSWSLHRAPTLGRVGGLSFTGLPLFAERIEEVEAYAYEHEVDWASGAILLISSECYADLHGFDERYFLYSEETDFCLRAWDAGWATLYTPEAGAMHVGGGSGESGMTHAMQALNRVRLYRRRAGAARAWLYFVLTVTLELRRALILRRRYAWHAVHALVWPRARPAVLHACGSLLPPS